MSEPFGHRGHPTTGEFYRARGTAGRIGVAITVLQEEGFSHDEAVAFISGVCLEVARDRGETWSDRGRNARHNAFKTIEGIMLGKGAKHWALDVIDISLATIRDMLES